MIGWPSLMAGLAWPGGRVLRAMADSLGEYVVRDFLRTRSAGMRGR